MLFILLKLIKYSHGGVILYSDSCSLSFFSLNLDNNPQVRNT